MGGRTIAFDGYVEFAAGDAPVGPIAVAAGEGSFFHLVRVVAGFFDALAADIKVIRF